MAIGEKHLKTLEFPKVLAKLADLTAFSASATLAHTLRPTADVEQARRRQLETAEAWQLLVTHPDRARPDLWERHCRHPGRCASDKPSALLFRRGEGLSRTNQRHDHQRAR